MRAHNLVILARDYPALADYRVMDSQPRFWLDLLLRYADAENMYNEKNKPKT